MMLTFKIFTKAAGKTVFSSEQVLEGPSVTIGRSKSCTLSLEDPDLQLSRIQAELVRTGPGYMLKVISKNSPVLVNGRTHPPGTQTMVGTGDTLSMAGYDLEIVSTGEAADADPEATRAVGARPQPATALERKEAENRAAAVPSSQAAAAPPVSPAPRPQPAAAPAGTPVQGSGRGKLIGIAIAAVVLVLGAVLLWPTVKGMLPDKEAQQRAAEADQAYARLEGEARALIKLLDTERRERKDAVTASASDIARIEDQLRAARSAKDKSSLQTSLREARATAALNTVLEQKVRDQTDGPNGLPKAEGNLSAAAAAAKGKDKTAAVKLLEETVVALTAVQNRIAGDRKATQGEQLKRQEQLQVAETRASAEAEARAKAEADARSRAEIQARIKAELDARAKTESQAKSVVAAKATPVPQATARVEPAPAPAAKAPAAAAGEDCFARLAGNWTHATGGTWTFSGRQGTLVVNPKTYGPQAQQITVLAVSSCEGETMAYKITRRALLNTTNPSFQYDRTPVSAPNLPDWGRNYSQPYVISVNGLKFGNYTFAKH